MLSAKSFTRRRPPAEPPATPLQMRQLADQKSAPSAVSEDDRGVPTGDDREAPTGGALTERQLRSLSFQELLELWPDPQRELQLRLDDVGGGELLSCRLLHAAVAADNRDGVRGLLEMASGLAELSNSRRELPIHVACRLNRPLPAALLLPAMSREAVNSLDGRGRAPLHWAVELGEADCLAELLVSDLCDLALPDSSGRSALDCAREAGPKARACLRLLESAASAPSALAPLRLRRLEPARSHGCRDGEPRAWGAACDSALLANNCFGEVEFPGLGNTAQFCRVAQTCSDADISQLLLGCWALSRPSLVLSVHGSDCDKASFKAAWQKGLWKTAAGSGAWIVTDCCSGLARKTGQAARDFCDAYGPDSVRAIGVCSWGRSAGRECLRSESFAGCNPAHYKSDSPSDGDSDSSADSLDPNHSHLLLVDCAHRDRGCDCCRSDTSWLFRSRFEALLKDWPKLAAGARDSGVGGISETDLSDAASSVSPLCCLLACGMDSSSLYGLHASVHINRTPLLIIAGTGGLADLLAKLLKDVNESAAEADSTPAAGGDPLSSASLTSRLQEAWDLPPDTPLDEEVRLLRQLVVESRHRIDLFTLDVDSASDLDGRILACLLNSAGGGGGDDGFNGEQLRMAMALDRSDIAKEKVLSGSGRRWRDGELDKFMLAALRENRVAFARLFVQQGFGLESFVTVRLLETLYTEDYCSGTESTRIFRNCLDASTGRRNMGSVCLPDIGRLLQRLAGKRYQTPYPVDEASRQGGEQPMERPARDLFIWCLLTQRKELAEFFWTLEKECVPAALLAALLLRQIRDFSDDISEKEELEEIAYDFESKAEGVLNACAEDDQAKSQANLVRQLQHYGESTSLLLAAEGDSIRFISHKICHQLLDNAWMGSLSEKKNGSLKFALQLIAGLLCPFFLPLLVHYKSDNETDISSTVGADRGGEVSADESSKSHKKQTFASRIWSKAGGRVDPELGDGIIVDADEKTSRPRRCCMSFGEYRRRILDFYSAPVVRFSYTTISYLAFLCLYSYTLLFKFGPSLPNWSASHLLLYVWVLSLVLEELRQALLSKISFSAYISDTWNIFDIVAILLFNIGAISFILRLATPVVEALFGVQGDQAGISSSQETLLRLSRLCLALALFVFFLRILQFFSISVTLGPKVVMIQNMITNDLMPFMVILLTFTFGYGIAMWSITFPTNDPSISEAMVMIVRLMRVSYFQIYGEMNMDLITGLAPTCATDPSTCADVWGAWIAPILLGIHMILANGLLFNLLIAMFSHTYELVDASGRQHWSLQRYLLMREFSERSPIAPPLVALWHLAWPLRFLAKRCCVGDVGGDAHSGDTPFKTSYADDRQKERQLMQWERIRALEFLRNLEESPSGQSAAAASAEAKPMVLRAAGVNKELEAVRSQLEESFKESLREVDGRVRRLDSMEAQLGQLKDLLEGLKDRLSERHIEVVTSIKNCSIRAAAPESPSATHEVQPSDSVSPSAKSKRKAGDWHWPQSGHFDEELDDPAASDVQPSAWLVALHQHKLCRLLPIGCLSSRKSAALSLCGWADPESTDAIEDSFNGFDQAGGFSRKSHGGRYAVANSAPRNPYKSCTSTTAPDRGGLPLWGPNHCAVLAVTRWKRDDRQNAVKRGGRPVLQAATIVRANRQEFPSFLVKHCSHRCSATCCNLANELKAWLSDRVESVADSANTRSEIQTAALKHSVLPGSPDSQAPSAWLETELVNLHEAFSRKFDSQAMLTALAGDGEFVTWMDVGNQADVSSTQSAILKSLAEAHKAYY
ncbi:hypothetical protein BOX15_Mlig003066g1 [Macrostomum lignano]|uniref:Uncharacterized protein n=2 Tax=Macrostomum lignano TaxID=282301 RepID=A0A267GI71_9PLAT|nr:hypothetical protein BOX15_Mlig003066g1 [Macrostomum lignano]